MGLFGIILVQIEGIVMGGKSNLEVKSLTFPSVYGVGFIGVGKHRGSIGGKQTKPYKTWKGMLERCYSKNYQNRQPTYIGCTVCLDWHNFQNFAKWYHENHPTDGGNYHLDKDIKIEGNKEYSPSACMFVSPEDNAIKARAKSYTFRSPNGDVVEVYNLNKFCRDNDLYQGSMSAVHSGKRKSHKGWAKIQGV